MNRQKAIRCADVWRVDNRTQEPGTSLIEVHDSISAAKRFTRATGKCVALQPEDRGHGEQVFGFFSADNGG